jgi:hypothetical protein
MKPFSLVIAGPIKSRFNEKIDLDSIVKAREIIKNINIKNELIISTYQHEILYGLDGIADRVVTSIDPGPDYFKTDPWPISPRIRRVQSNITRSFTTSLAGIRISSNSIVIKTRIELLPERADQFTLWLEEIMGSIEDKKIAFFIENYTGFSFSVNGILGMIPDVMQVTQKEVGIQIWEDALDFWSSNKSLLTRRFIRYPVTVEQIIGFTFLARYHNFDLAGTTRFLRRQYVSKKLLYAVIEAEQLSFLFTRYRDSGFAVNYFAGLISLRLPVKLHPTTKLEYAQRLSIFFAKKIRHHQRRISSAYLEELKRVASRKSDLPNS